MDLYRWFSDGNRGRLITPSINRKSWKSRTCVVLYLRRNKMLWCRSIFGGEKKRRKARKKIAEESLPLSISSLQFPDSGGSRRPRVNAARFSLIESKLQGRRKEGGETAGPTLRGNPWTKSFQVSFELAFCRQSPSAGLYNIRILPREPEVINARNPDNAKEESASTRESDRERVRSERACNAIVIFCT